MSSNNNAQPRRRGPGPGGPGGGQVIRKPKNFKASLQKLWKYSKPFYPLIIVAFVLGIISAVLTVLGPNYLADITENIQNYLAFSYADPKYTLDITTITQLGIILVVIYSLSFVFSAAQNFLLATYTRKTSHHLRRDLSSKLNTVPLKYIDEQGVGNTLSRFTNDIDTLAQSLNQSIGQIISGISLLIGSIVMMFYTNWIMALTAIGASLLDSL